MDDISNVQRDLANVQKQIKSVTDQVKKETDTNRKAILQKKLIDLNTKKSNLNKEMEDLVTSIGVGQELEFAEGFTKWNKYKESKMKKLTETEKIKIFKYAKGLVKEDDSLDYKTHSISNKIFNYFIDNDMMSNKHKSISNVKAFEKWLVKNNIK